MYVRTNGPNGSSIFYLNIQPEFGIFQIWRGFGDPYSASKIYSKSKLFLLPGFWMGPCTGTTWDPPEFQDFPPGMTG